MSTTPDLNALLPMSAGLAFETMLIASLYVATAAGVLIAARRRRLIGALGGIAVFGFLATNSRRPADHAAGRCCLRRLRQPAVRFRLNGPLPFHRAFIVLPRRDQITASPATCRVQPAP